MIMAKRLDLGDMTVEVILKNIKNVGLSVHPPLGQVRISAPRRIDLDALRVFAISKLDWIRRQQRRLREQARETPRGIVLNSESHFVWGQRCLLAIEESKAAGVELQHQRLVLRATGR